MTTYSYHARQQMNRRGITEDDVEAVLRRPLGDPQPGSRPDTVLVTGYALGGRLLQVVVDSVEMDHVVTAYEG